MTSAITVPLWTALRLSAGITPSNTSDARGTSIRTMWPAPIGTSLYASGMNAVTTSRRVIVLAFASGFRTVDAPRARQIGIAIAVTSTAAAATPPTTRHEGARRAAATELSSAIRWAFTAGEAPRRASSSAIARSASFSARSAFCRSVIVGAPFSSGAAIRPEAQPASSSTSPSRGEAANGPSRSAVR